MVAKKRVIHKKLGPAAICKRHLKKNVRMTTEEVMWLQRLTGFGEIEIKRLGLDLHGVLDTHLTPELLVAFRSRGIEIHILSGPTTKQVITELGVLGYRKGVHYDYIMSVVDWLKTHGVRMWQVDSDWWADDDDWWASKGDYCKLHHIDVVVDNSPKYKSHMPKTTKFILMR